MNEQLQNALAKLLTSLMSSIQDGAMFAQEQLPEVLDQLLTYKLVRSLGISCVLLAFGLIYTWKVLPKFWKAAREGFDGSEVIVIFVTALIYTVVGIALFNAAWIQILIAPKVYLIEYAASLAK